MIRRLLLPVALVGALAACGGGDDDAGASAPAPAVDEAPAAAPDAPDAAEPPTVASDVPEALQFTAPLVGGGDLDAAALAGRPVLLWFWAPW